ncbi:8510_t:CDS:2 [Dentiscutata erythropus]|uniref:8510_t:CDS:1 n=1 Tax=Dentiscutata erythropus TaxID=1348616 RepID=A0A9N8ZBG6_9GLOM|nr:8510_t:CDS:2 [Dentiscutata erythropus]
MEITEAQCTESSKTNNSSKMETIKRSRDTKRKQMDQASTLQAE